MIDKILTNQINFQDKECALLLSGGVDSISTGFMAHRLGKKITAYSFCLDTNVSYDYLKAEEVSNKMDWSFVGVKIPTANLVDDWYRLVEFGCKKKTHYECLYPFLYVYPEIKEKYVLSGLGADGYYGNQNWGQRKWKIKESKENFDAYRDFYFTPEQQGHTKDKELAAVYKKILITPYITKPVKEYFYQFDWAQLNKPKQKNDVREGFKEFELIGKVKNHQHLQGKVSGITELFETLLNNRDINYLRRGRMLDVCHDWRNGITATLY
jgi:asparagine synthetase B (glutamine-hydrolysing)